MGSKIGTILTEKISEDNFDKFKKEQPLTGIKSSEI